MLIRKLTLPLLFCVFLFPPLASAQELVSEDRSIWRAEVLEIIEQEEREIPGTETSYIFQLLRAEILEGPKEGEIVEVENDFAKLDQGDSFFINHIVTLSGEDRYSVNEVDRRQPLLILGLLFVFAVVVLGGWQGVRALLALLGSFLAIFYVLMPGLLGGWSPLLASFLVAALILFAAIFFTHGFNRESIAAFGGTMIAVVLTGILAIIAVHFTDLTGFTSDDAVYLNFNTQGSLDFTGLLLGAIIIGVLGVLDDIAVTQAAVVSELWGSNESMKAREVYRRALRVGREHVGALVNTLVLAYTGTALPLLLLFYGSSASLGNIVNREIFAAEIVRTIIGSIGLVMTVPIVTALAVFLLRDAPRRDGSHHHHHAH